MATIFLNLTDRQKPNRQRLYTPKSSKIKLFEGEKVFRSGLTVCVLLEAVKA